MQPPSDGLQLHASCVNLPKPHGGGVLLLGDSGAGKSDLALRLIDSGAMLVADDRVNLVAVAGQLLASAPESIAGKIELRGVGILTLPHLQNIPLKLAVSLDKSRTQERLPEPAFFDCLGVRLSLLSLHPFEDSVCAKIRLYLQHGI